MLNIKIKQVRSSVCFVSLAVYFVIMFSLNNANATYRGEPYMTNYAYNVPPISYSAPPRQLVVSPPVYESPPYNGYNYFNEARPYQGPYPIESWAGPYFGLLLGFNETETEFQHKKYISNLKNADMDFGLMGGVNFQSDTLVYGLEGDALFPVSRHRNEDVIIKGNFSGNLRTRVGVAIGKWMPYGFIGMGTKYTTVKEEHVKDGSNFENFHLDYIYGAGADFKISNGLFAKLEGTVNNTSKQNANLEASHIHFKDRSYSLYVGIAERF